MRKTSQAYNQAIMHIAFREGGEPFCRSRRAHMSTTAEKSAGWTVCKRCAAKLAAMQERQARRQVTGAVQQT